MTDNWEDFRTEQGGGKGISFGGVGDRSQIGVIKGGRVLDVKPKQEVRDFKTKELKKTKSGRQLYQLPVLLQTQERAHPDDDGQRILYVKGLMFDAIDEALKTAGRETVEIGGILEIAYVGDRPVGDGEMRSFKARYTPAPPQAAQNQAGVWGGQQTAPPQQLPAADPFGGGQQPHPSEAFAAAGGPPAQQWPNQPAAGQPQGPPPGWGQPGPQGYANGGPVQPADPWGQPPQQPPGANPNAWGSPGPGRPAPAGPPPSSLQDQWAAAGQQGQQPPVDPWA